MVVIVFLVIVMMFVVGMVFVVVMMFAVAIVFVVVMALCMCRGVRDHTADPFHTHRAHQKRIDVLRERRFRGQFQTQSVHRHLQEDIVQSNDVFECRRESGRATDHSCTHGLDCLAITLEFDGGRDRTIGHVIVPPVVVCELILVYGDIPGRTGTTKAAENQ